MENLPMELLEFRDTIHGNDQVAHFSGNDYTFRCASSLVAIYKCKYRRNGCLAALYLDKVKGEFCVQEDHKHDFQEEKMRRESFPIEGNLSFHPSLRGRNKMIRYLGNYYKYKQETSKTRFYRCDQWKNECKSALQLNKEIEEFVVIGQHNHLPLQGKRQVVRSASFPIEGNVTFITNSGRKHKIACYLGNLYSFRREFLNTMQYRCITSRNKCTAKLKIDKETKEFCIVGEHTHNLRTNNNHQVLGATLPSLPIQPSSRTNTNPCSQSSAPMVEIESSDETLSCIPHDLIQSMILCEETPIEQNINLLHSTISCRKNRNTTNVTVALGSLAGETSEATTSVQKTEVSFLNYSKGRDILESKCDGIEIANLEENTRLDGNVGVLYDEDFDDSPGMGSFNILKSIIYTDIGK